MMSQRLVPFEEIENTEGLPITVVQDHIKKVQEAYWELEQQFEDVTNLLREVVDSYDDSEDLEEIISKAKGVLEEVPYEYNP